MGNSLSNSIPDFIGVGAIKSGTTWLHAQLSEHPGLMLPSVKELEFFDSRFDLGWKWYGSFFAESGGRVCGEISPQYMHSEASVQRICTLNGQCKLLVMLRDPIHRAYSHFMMDARARNIPNLEKPRMFHEIVCAGGSKYIAYGEYARQLEPLRSAFDRANIWIGLFEDISARPARLVSDVFAFLGVDPDYVPSKLSSKINPSKKYRSLTLFTALQAVTRAAERSWLRRMVIRLKTSGLRDRVISLLEQPSEYLPMLPETKSALIDHYSVCNRELSSLFGVDVTPWSS